MFENDVLKITALGARIDEYWGDFEMDLMVENKTDKKVNVSLEGVLANGYAMDSYLYCTLEPGASDTDDITIDAEDLKKLGLQEPDEVLLLFEAQENGKYDGSYLLRETVSVYPTGKQPGEIEIPERRTAAGEKVIADNEQFCFVILELQKDSMSNWSALVYMENRSDKALSFEWDEVKVQGKEIDVWFSEDVPAGARMYDEVFFYESKMKEAGLTEVSSLEFVLQIEDAEDWFADPLLEETFLYP